MTALLALFVASQLVSWGFHRHRDGEDRQERGRNGMMQEPQAEKCVRMGSVGAGIVGKTRERWNGGAYHLHPRLHPRLSPSGSLPLKLGLLLLLDEMLGRLLMWARRLLYCDKVTVESAPGESGAACCPLARPPPLGSICGPRETSWLGCWGRYSPKYCASLGPSRPCLMLRSRMPRKSHCEGVINCKGAALTLLR